MFFVGEFASAKQTLETAISQMKQSNIANDERCNILISSLQDMLHGIESANQSETVDPVQQMKE